MKSQLADWSSHQQWSQLTKKDWQLTQWTRQTSTVKNSTIWLCCWWVDYHCVGDLTKLSATWPAGALRLVGKLTWCWQADLLVTWHVGILTSYQVEHSNSRFESIRYANQFESIRFVKNIGLSIHYLSCSFSCFIVSSQKNKLTSLFAAFNTLKHRQKTVMKCIL